MTSNRTVHIVDDDLAARESVAALVMSHGLQAATYDSGERFLAEYDRSKQGCLVADVRMRGMTGLELQQRLIAEEIVLPVILITGFADVPMAVQAMQAGAVSFLQKPCKREELWNSIQRALEIEGVEREQTEQRERILERIAQLSEDEQRVMGKVVEGLPNKRIATQLGIGLRTVELRRAKVLKVLEADSLAALVRMAILVDFKPPS